ncbi:MAG: cytochrome b/b6 domain-containing protein [Candidatus Thermoplasmatota archaeon]|nr:cytochrome b/b6 domain-containing protein [Candidatus Thermoplasmatota archaeon]
MRRGALILSFVVLVFAFQNVSAATCEDCHSASDPRPSGGFVFSEPLIRASYDSVVIPKEDFDLVIWIVPTGDYSIIRSNATLIISHPLEPRSEFRADGSMGSDRMAVRFRVQGLDVGIAGFWAHISYTVRGVHTTPGSIDTSEYAYELTGAIIIDEMALRVSPGSLLLEDTDRTSVITLEAMDDAYDVRVELDPHLRAYIRLEEPDDTLITGAFVSVPVRLLFRGDVSGNITVSWYSNGSMYALSIPVSILPEKTSEAGSDLYHEIGKYTGIASMLLLIIGYFTGGTGLSRKMADKLFGGASKRIKFHCAMSYEVLLLALFHLAVLFYGPFRGFDRIVSWQSSLGVLAMILMFVIALNGIFQGPLVRSIGGANWRRIHSWGSYLATCLVVLHALMIGSHFYWFRDIIGAS